MIKSLTNLFFPSHLETLKRDLDRARVNHAKHVEHLEYYRATVPMLEKRIRRLEKELDRYTDAQPTTPF